MYLKHQVFSFQNLCFVVCRGKCKVRPFVEIDSVKGYIQKDDCFFYVLGYNPETRYDSVEKKQTYMESRFFTLVVTVQIDTAGCLPKKVENKLSTVSRQG